MDSSSANDTNRFLGGSTSERGGDYKSHSNNHSFANASDSRLSRALERVDIQTNALHKRLNIVYVSLLGFVLIGLCALGCVTFGVVEIIGGDAVFENEGFGEVLTVLGTYFSIPYVFVIGLFLVLTVSNPATRLVSSMVSRYHSILILAGITIVYTFQAAITNYYMVILTSSLSLIILVFDVIAVGLILAYHRVDARGYIFSTALFGIKCAVLWGPAYKTVGTNTWWGPNGILCMLFLCIPMCELPLMASYLKQHTTPYSALFHQGEGGSDADGRSSVGHDQTSNGGGSSLTHGSDFHPVSPNFGPRSDGQQSADHLPSTLELAGHASTAYNTPSSKEVGGGSRRSNPHSTAAPPPPSAYRFSGVSSKMAELADADFVDHFASHFGLYLNHVMHTIDLITLFNFAFIAPTTNAKQREAPLPFRVLIAILFCVGFFANNATMLHLFYKRDGVQSANIPLLKPIIRAANRTVKASAWGDHDPDRDAKKSYQRRLFQYMLLMLALVDIPLLICRLELWAGQYAALSIFVAKNIKDIVDVAMLTLRVNENIRQNEESGGGGGGGGSGSVGGALIPPQAGVFVPIQPPLREPSL